MAGGKVGDGYIEVHADDKPFQKEMAGVQRTLKAELDKRGDALGKSLAKSIGDSLGDTTAPFEKAARAAMRAFRAEAIKSGTAAGKAIADHIADGMRDRLQERGKIVGKQAVQAVKRAASAAGPVKIDVEADTAKARRDIKKVADDQDVTLNADADTKAAAAKIAWTSRSRSVDLWLDAHTTRARAQIASLVKGLSGWTMLMGWSEALTAFATRLPQTTLKVGLLYSSLASLVNPVLLLVRAIGPLASGLWHIAQGAVAIAPATLALVTIFGTLKATFTKMEENTNRFVQKASSNMKQWTDNWVYVRKEIQVAFFESNRFNKAFASFGRNVVFAETFRRGLKDVAAELSDLVSGGLEALTTSLHPGTTKAFFGGLVDGLRVAGPGLAALGRAVGIIAQRGSDLFVGMGEQIARWGQQIEQWATRTDISAMARKAWEEWGALWGLLKNMGRTVGNIFIAMNPPGSAMSALERMANTWERVANVTEGGAFQSAMRTIFAGAAAGAGALADALDPIGDNLSDFTPTLGKVLTLLGQIGAVSFTGLSTILGDRDFGKGIEAAFAGIREMVAGIDFRAVGDLFGNLGQSIGIVAPMLDDFVNAFVEVANEIVVTVMPVLRMFSDWVQENPGAIRELIVQLLAAKVAFGALGGAMSLANLLGANSGQGFRTVGQFLGSIASRGVPAAAAVTGVGDAAAAAAGAGRVGMLARFAPALAGIGPAALVAGGAIAVFAAVRMNNEQRVAALEAERASVDDYVAALKKVPKGGDFIGALNKQVKAFDAEDMGRSLNTLGKQVKYLNEVPTGGFNEWVSNLFGAKTASQQASGEIKKVSEALAGTDYATASSAFKQIADDAAQSTTEMVKYTTGYGYAVQEVTTAGVNLATVAQQPGFEEYRAKLQSIAEAYGITSLSAADFDQWMAGKVPTAISTAAASSPQLTSSLSEIDAGFAGVTASAYRTAQALADPDTATRNLTASVQAAVDAIYGLQSAQSGSVASGLSSFYTGLTNAKIAADNLKGGLDILKPAGAANQAVLDGIASSTKSVVTQMASQGATQEQLTDIANKGRTAFLDQYVAAVSGAKNYKGATDEVKAAAQQAATAAGLIPGKTVAQIVAQTTGEDQVNLLTSQIAGLQGKKAELLVEVQTPEVQARIAEIDRQMAELAKKTALIKVNYGVGDTSAVESYAPTVDGKVIVKIGENEFVTWDPKNKTAYVDIKWGSLPKPLKVPGGTMKVSPGANGGILHGRWDTFANGGFMRNFRAFASGTERHVAQIAAAGTNRLWAEPETGGEAYIPLAVSKRARSRRIWAQTGKELDMFADGGLRGSAAAAYGDSGKYIGMMTMGGLMSGIKSGSGALSAALVEPMKQALTDFRNFMGIHSDSDTMIDLGGHITGGTATGIVKAGPKVSKAVKDLIRKYVINSADFAAGTAAFAQLGTDLATALSYGLRDNGALLSDVLRGMATNASDAISDEIDRITDETDAANAKLTAGKKKANKAGDKVLNAQIKANKAALEKQVKLLEQYKSDVADAFAAQSETSDLAIWWRLGEDAGAKEMAKWAQGTASTITTATLGDISKAQDVLKGMLKDATALRTSVSESLTSGLSLKGLTNVKQLTSTLSSWASRATMFAGKLKELAKKGYPAAFIQQVAGLGFADGPGVADALLAASATDVAQINADYSTILTQADAIGSTVVDAMYGVGADATTGFIDGLTSDLAALSAAGETLGDALVASVAKALGLSNVNLPSVTVPSVASAASVGTPVSISGLGATGASGTTTTTVQQNGTSLYINGNLIGSNPKVEQAVSLLLEVIGDKRLIERSGQTTG